jgi:hypothetical protein
MFIDLTKLSYGQKVILKCLYFEKVIKTKEWDFRSVNALVRKGFIECGMITTKGNEYGRELLRLEGVIV